MGRTVPNGYYSNLDPPLWCPICQEAADDTHWTKNFNARNTNGFSWLCKNRKNQRNRFYYQDMSPEQKEKRQAADAARYARNPEYVRWKSYRHWDAKKYGGNTVEFDLALDLMLSPCFFCSKPRAGGLDRKDSSLGHIADNVVACCAVCNNILSDLPWIAKLCLQLGLTEMFLTGAAADWLPPTMRKKEIINVG